jgi:Ca2+-binding RTX toxin-like protein
VAAERFDFDGGSYLNGGSGNDKLTGGNYGNDISDDDTAADLGSDTINGGAGNDTILSRGGADAIDGGADNDTLTFNRQSKFGDLTLNMVDLAIVATVMGDGSTIVNVETLIYHGGKKADTVTALAGKDTIYGYDGNDKLSGGAGDDFLHGGNGADILDGGDGTDTMVGGMGDDIYYSDGDRNFVREFTGGGTDTLRTYFGESLSYNLESIENLELLGTLGAGGYGNALDNRILGNSANNVLDGLGGADFTAGGLGNDTYYIENAGDVVTEGVNEGLDIVKSNLAAATLAANVEKLLLLTAALEATGNALSNHIYGNDAGNKLNGGAGADRLLGGKGDDNYYLDSSGDRVFETIAGAAGGVDKVFTRYHHTLGANFENLALLNAGNFNGTGNELVNIIYGSSGNNFIDGKGAADTLTGGLGLDNFVFTTGLGASNIDTIADFSVADVTIRLENAIFAALPVGYLAVTAFHIGAAAADAGDRIIYNSATGALFCDADGLGGAAQVRFASLSAGLAMTNADFFVF